MPSLCVKALLWVAVLVLGAWAAPTEVINTNKTALFVQTPPGGAPLETVAHIKPSPNAQGTGLVAIPTVVTQFFSPKYPNSTLIDINGGVPVFVQIQFIQVKKINGVEEEFTADFYFRAWWPDQSVCPNGANPEDMQFDAGNSWYE